MKTTLLVAATIIAGPLPVWAQASGDPERGERVFRQCQACHVVADETGQTLAGRNATNGPNLYRLPGRAAASVEGFRYSAALVAAGRTGLVWTEENFVAFVQDPEGFLRDHLDQPNARTPMTFRVRKKQDAVDVYAYLAALAEED